MSVYLYHFTNERRAALILRHGFAGTSCWLSPDVATVFGEAARSALIELDLNAAMSDLAPYARPIGHMEIWDDAANAFVPDAIERPEIVWYELPVAVVRSKGRLKSLSASRRASLMSGEPDVVSVSVPNEDHSEPIRPPRTTSPSNTAT